MGYMLWEWPYVLQFAGPPHKPGWHRRSLALSSIHKMKKWCCFGSCSTSGRISWKSWCLFSPRLTDKSHKHALPICSLFFYLVININWLSYLAILPCWSNIRCEHEIFTLVSDGVAQILLISLEKLPPYGRRFSSSCGGLQPLAAMVGPFGPNSGALWAHQM